MSRTDLILLPIHVKTRPQGHVAAQAPPHRPATLFFLFSRDPLTLGSRLIGELVWIWGAFSDLPGQSKSEPSFKTKSENPREFSDLERKKETADVELSRLLRKPGKRNGAGIF